MIQAPRATISTCFSTATATSYSRSAYQWTPPGQELSASQIQACHECSGYYGESITGQHNVFALKKFKNNLKKHCGSILEFGREEKACFQEELNEVSVEVRWTITEEPTSRALTGKEGQVKRDAEN